MVDCRPSGPESPFPLRDGRYAIKTGLSGPFSKTGVLRMDAKGHALSFTKLAIGPEANASIEREARALARVGSLAIDGGLAPRLLGSGSVLGKSYVAQAAFEPDRERADRGRLDAEVVRFLSALARESMRTEHEVGERWLATIDERLGQAPDWVDRALCEATLQLRAHVADDLRAAGARRGAHGGGPCLWMAHGDLTPWNVSRSKGRPVVFDWELAREMAPPFYDLVHFVVQPAVLVSRQSASRIAERVRAVLVEHARAWPEDVRELVARPGVLLRAYLLETVSFYFDLYARRRPAFEQVDWLLTAWHDLAVEAQKMGA